MVLVVFSLGTFGVSESSVSNNNLALDCKQPQTKDAADSFGGLGATLVDSLDTLYIMGLDQQFQRARE